MKNNETKCKDVLRWQCVLRCYFVPSKTFSRNKTHKIVHLVPLKTFSRNKMRVHQIFAVYDVRFGKGESDEISRDAPSFMTFAERRRFELLIPFRGIHAFQACLLSHSSISPITTLSAYKTRKQDCKYTNYL